jgi:alpha 1,6-mannosyltransferase
LQVITDDVAEILIEHLYGSVPDVMETYRLLPMPVLKADFFRYLILFARGGIYADIDTEVLRPAHLWLPNTSPAATVGIIVGIEADSTREDWATWYARRIQFCQWVMRAKVGHPILRETIARITEFTLRRRDEGQLTVQGLASLSIIEWTGPAVWTDAIFWYMNAHTKTGKGTKAGAEMEEWSWRQFTGITEPKQVGDVLVLPITGFSPGIGHMGSLEPDDPHAMVLHHFGLSNRGGGVNGRGQLEAGCGEVDWEKWRVRGA